AGGIQGVRRRQRAGRLPFRWLDGARVGRATAGGVARAAGITPSPPGPLSHNGERGATERRPKRQRGGVGFSPPPPPGGGGGPGGEGGREDFMDHFTYKDRILHCEDVPVRALAETYGTPLFVYSQATLLHHLKQLQTAFADVEPLICYSLKTNGNLSLCRLMA